MASTSPSPPDLRKTVKKRSQGATPQHRTLPLPNIARCDTSTSHPATLSCRTLRHHAIMPVISTHRTVRLKKAASDHKIPLLVTCYARHLNGWGSPYRQNSCADRPRCGMVFHAAAYGRKTSPFAHGTPARSRSCTLATPRGRRLDLRHLPVPRGFHSHTREHHSGWPTENQPPSAQTSIPCGWSRRPSARTLGRLPRNGVSALPRHAS